MVTKFFMPVFALAVVFSSGGVCVARLGETEAELKERYGEPSEPERKISAGQKRLYFFKEGVHVDALVFQDHCVWESYVFISIGGPKPKAVPPAENMQKVELLLKANSAGARWEKRPPREVNDAETILFWERSDGKAVAMVFKELPEILQVADASYLDACEKALQNSQKPDELLKGF